MQRELSRHPARKLHQELSYKALGVVTGLVMQLDANDNGALIDRSGASLIRWHSTPRYSYTAGPQSTATKRPSLTTANLKRQNVIGFDGGDTLMLSSNLYSIPNGKNTLFAVARRNSETGANNKIITMTEAGSQRYALDYAATAGVCGYQSRNASGLGVNPSGNTNTNYQILTAFRSGTTQSISINNGTATTNTNGNDESGCNAAFIGSLADSASYLTGAIAEILLYNRALTAREILSVNRYLSKKWGVAIS